MSEINMSKGTMGMMTQVPGAPATVSEAALMTGGIGGGNFIEPDIDEELFRFNSDDTPLMNLMLKAKRVKVSSPEVDHYMIDEPRSSVRTQTDIKSTGAMQVVLPLAGNEQSVPRLHTTLLVRGVDGYSGDGSRRTPGKDLMLFVTGRIRRRIIRL